MDKIDKQRSEVLEYIFDNTELLEWLGDSADKYDTLGKFAKGKADKFIAELTAKCVNLDKAILGQ